jgi:hypothetical protein
MSNFQGSIILAERGMVVEANTLTRNCYENGFWIAALFIDRAEAVKALRLDETKSQSSRAEVFMRVIESHADPETREKARAGYAARGARAKGRAVGLEDLARSSGLYPNYFAYKELSAHSAHSSLNSLERYLDRNPDGDWEGFVFGPESDRIKDAIDLACQALFSALTVVGHFLGPSEEDQPLYDLYERYLALAGVSTD